MSNILILEDDPIQLENLSNLVMNSHPDLHVLKASSYIEALRREIIVHTAQNGYRSKSCTLRTVAELLPDFFVRCHRAFIVNTHYSIIYDRAKDELRIDDVDVSIPVGRKYRNSIQL
ncbi:MAG: LytTR family transcriptional regulator [Lachnospiraceae bacterium]|nr:LytTR family transcriptional regulator [Lachnospiraceae bacterium]